MKNKTNSVSISDVTIIISNLGFTNENIPFPVTYTFRNELDSDTDIEDFIKHINRYHKVIHFDRLGAIRTYA